MPMIGSIVTEVRNWKLLVFVASAVWLVGCSPSREPKSAIVEKAQQAGAGDVTHASAASVEDWFRKHRTVAVEVSTMCAPAREKGDATWGDSTEGHVCLAAKNAATSTYRYPSDDKQYHSGWK